MKFTVYGTPVPQGSTRAFIPKGWTRPIITAANPKTKPWRQQVTGTAMAEIERSKFEPKLSSVSLTLDFYFEKPKSASKSPIAPKLTKPDLDKLIRAILDSLTGVAFADDSQVTTIMAAKMFGSPARVEIEIV